MKSEVIKRVREFVEEECKKPTSKYGSAPYLNHFVPMVKYAKMLAEKYNTDKEIIEIAAWLHDIGSIVYGRENHHITGAEIAERKLKEFGYPRERIEKVKKCILNHRGSVPSEKKSAEERIIADADAMSVFDDVTGRIHAAIVYEKLSREKARESVKFHLVNSFNKVSSEAKEIVRPKYEAAMLLLK